MDKKILKSLQDLELGILVILDEYCRSHDIKYSLAAGTLLGAVRHGGFLPWDDDVDISMTRAEYTKFCNCIRDNPVPGFGFSNFENDIHTTVSHGKFYKEGTLFLQEGDIEGVGHHEIWVDIFPLDKIPLDDSSRKTIKIGREIVLLTRANGYRLNDSFIKRIVRFFIRCYPNRQDRMKKDMDELIKLDNEIKQNYEWISMSTINSIKTVRYSRELLEEYTTIRFEEYEFMVYSGYREMLKQLYGDYMRLPPESERVCKHSPVRIQF